MRPTRSGPKRQRVLLFDIPESSTDSWAQPSLAPTQISSSASDGAFAAEVRPLRGNEILNTRQIWPTATHIVKLRFLWSAIPKTPDNPNGLIVPQMKLQVLLDNSILNILFADNVEKRNHEWVLTCEEHINATQ